MISGHVHIKLSIKKLLFLLGGHHKKCVPVGQSIPLVQQVTKLYVIHVTKVKFLILPIRIEN
jgi:hypothetical protein